MTLTDSVSKLKKNDYDFASAYYFPRDLFHWPGHSQCGHEAAFPCILFLTQVKSEMVVHIMYCIMYDCHCF